MAAPTQQLPPWLSYSTTTITGANGSPIATSTTLVYLPLTYYGPSIPLGSLWTYGGLTSPVPTAAPASSSPITSIAPPTVITTTITSISTTTATPSVTPTTSSPSPVTTPSSSSPSSSVMSSSSTSASSSLSSTLSSSSALSPTATSTSPSLSPSSTFTPVSSSSRGGATQSPSAAVSSNHRKVLLGAILGSVLGALLLGLLLFLCIRWTRRRRSPRTPIWTGWEFVSPPQQSPSGSGSRPHSPGEGSPRHSGEEIDPFLQRSSRSQMAQAENGARLASVPGGVAAGVVDESDGSSVGSGYGTVVEPGVAMVGGAQTRDEGDPGPYERRQRYILPPSELLRVEEESSSITSHNTPLMPPPPLDPDRRRNLLVTGSNSPTRRSAASGSYPTTENEADENATLLTARRVRVQDLPVDLSPTSTAPTAGRRTAGLAGALGAGLEGLARLGRLSWALATDSPPARFRTVSSSNQSQSSLRPRVQSRPGSLFGQGRRLSDAEVETGRAMLDAQPWRRSRLGEFGNLLDRPISTVSGKTTASSGNTMFYDARSTPGTPLGSTPVPRPETSQAQQGGQSLSREQAEPPPYSARDAYAPSTGGDDGHTAAQSTGTGDVLDEPAPGPAVHFGSIGTAYSSASSRTQMPYPPGLIAASLKGPSLFRHANSDEEGEVTIDVLEEEPPSAPEGWRSLAGSALAMDISSRRTTFGLPRLVRPTSPTRSEQASLYSMRSHLSPRSAQTSGSAPASRHNLSVSGGSASTPRSAHSRSQGHSASSAGSMARSGSVSSDGRLRSRNENVGRASLSATGATFPKSSSRPPSRPGYTGGPLPPTPTRVP